MLGVWKIKGIFITGKQFGLSVTPRLLLSSFLENKDACPPLVRWFFTHSPGFLRLRNRASFRKKTPSYSLYTLSLPDMKIWIYSESVRICWLYFYNSTEHLATSNYFSTSVWKSIYVLPRENWAKIRVVLALFLLPSLVSLVSSLYERNQIR